MQPKIKLLRDELAKLAKHPHVGDVRHKGFMVGIELVKDKNSREPYPLEEKRGIRVCMEARKHGLIIRPLGNTVVLMPPLSISAQELKKMLVIVLKSIKTVIKI